MNKILLIFLMFGFVCNAQLMGVVNSQQSMSITAPPEPEPLTTRFIIAGASIAYNVFFFTESMKSTIESAYPGSTVFIYNHASPGETIGSYATGSVPNITNTLSLYGSDNASTKTYVIIDLGGNDRTNRGTWDSLTESEITSMSTNLNVILDAIEAKGFTPILNDQTYRIYDSTVDESYGILPYNENLIQPRILSRTSEFAFEDGQSFWQMYTLIYNDYETYLSSDNIHPSGTGYAALRTAFVNTICKYIFTGVPPTKIEKE